MDITRGDLTCDDDKGQGLANGTNSRTRRSRSKGGVDEIAMTLMTHILAVGVGQIHRSLYQAALAALLLLLSLATATASVY